MGNKQNLRAGDESTNVQGKEVTVNQYNGLTYSDVKEVAMDIFKSNFYELGEKVESLVNERAEEILSDYLIELKKQAPELIKNTEDPDVRYAILEAQKSYARLGDKEMSNLLVDVLIQRTMNQDESFAKLVLNEAITIIPKLTTKQIDSLTLIFIIRNLNFSNPVPFEEYYAIISDFINQMVTTSNDMPYLHLQFTGCLSISIGSADLKTILKHKFSALSDDEIAQIIKTTPNLSALERNWDNSKLCNSNLTSVGIAIALSNLKRINGLAIDLKIWIQE